MFYNSLEFYFQIRHTLWINWSHYRLTYSVLLREAKLVKENGVVRRSVFISL